MYNQTAFGGMLQGIVEITSIVLRPEPLNAKFVRTLNLTGVPLARLIDCFVINVFR
jgi:hypothetical protein